MMLDVSVAGLSPAFFSHWRYLRAFCCLWCSPDAVLRSPMLPAQVLRRPTVTVTANPTRSFPATRHTLTVTATNATQ